MLSIDQDSSSDPCCSSKPSDLVGTHEAPSQFSIRDYVFRSRNKDIRNNWPFAEKLLQICLNNGVQDLLPPLEPSSSIRACHLRIQADSSQLPKNYENKQTAGNGEEEIELVVSPDPSQYSLLEKRTQYFKAHQENIVDTELIRSDLVSTQTTEDPMASKVCPVCKSFASTSNTTLNAHIDQCLSSDQLNTAADVSKCPKAKVKPRKKRLMVDIYTTAPYCTLEELDKRNGTNWATDLALVAPINGANLETKTTKLPLSDTVDRGDVGDIYIDSNGMKLLILSKFNDPPPFIPRMRPKLKTSGKRIKASKTSCLIARKKSFEQECSTSMQDNPQKKKLRANIRFGDEIEAARDGDNTIQAHQGKEESLSQLSCAQERLRNIESTTLGHWVCSKRSDLSRKLDGKDMSKGSEKMFGTSKKLSFGPTQPDLRNSPYERRICSPNSSRSSVAMACSVKTKRVNIRFNAKIPMDSLNESYCPQSNLHLKSWPSDSLVDGCVDKISSGNKSSCPPSKTRKILISNESILSKRTSVSLEASNIIENKGLITPKKIQKHRSLSGCCKRLGNKYSNINGGSPGSDFALLSLKANEANEDHQSNLSMDKEKGNLDTVRCTDTYAQISDDDMDQNPEEHEESISRDESQIESQFQRSTQNQEVQNCEDAISNRIISQRDPLAGEHKLIAETIMHDGDFQTGSASTHEPYPCFTDHGKIGVENNQENSLSTSFRFKSDQDHNTFADMELSGSPISTHASTICSPSFEHDKVKDLETDQCAELIDSMQDKWSCRTVSKDNKIRLSSPAREPSCSCSQSLSRESQIPSHTGKKMASNLFIKPSNLPSFQHRQSVESPTESVITMASSKSSMNVSNPCSNARIQPTTNPILRLMGKDLVVNKEEPMQLPEFLPCNADYPTGAQFISFGPPNGNSFSYDNYYHYPIQTMASGQSPFQPHQGRPDNISQCDIDSSYLARGVIVIDDGSCEPNRNSSSFPQALSSPNLMASQGSFSSFPTPGPYARRAVNFHQGANLQGSFMFPLPSSLYFNPTQK